MWICRLNFPQRLIFSGLRFFNEPEIWLGTPSLKSLPEDLCLGFLRPEKIHRSQSGLNPRTLGLEAITLPLDHRGRQYVCVTPLLLTYVHSFIYFLPLCYQSFLNYATICLSERCFSGIKKNRLGDSICSPNVSPKLTGWSFTSVEKLKFRPRM